MKKFAIFTLTLALGAALLTGCGCMNTTADVTTLPTNGETVTPTTRPATAPTTVPATRPGVDSTESTGNTVPGTTGTMEGTMDEILGGSADDATTGNGRSGGMYPGRGRSYENGPRIR